MTFRSDANKFLRFADWLTELDAPMIGSLKRISKELDGIEDGELNASLVSQHRMIINQLMAQRPRGEKVEEDPIEAMMKSKGI